MYQKFNKIFALVFVILALGSCASDQEEKDPTDEELYNKASTSLEKKNYKKAIENFQEIERLYPFSKLALKAQIMSAYANYKDEEYDDAITVIDNFVKVNPGYKDVAYMYYLKAMCYYDRIADVKRDQQITENALTTLQEVVRRYPNSDYAKDAKIKIDLVRDHLAGKEMEVGRFYLQQGNYIAASNRFREVVGKYQTTTHIEEALYRLTETSLLLGLNEEAKKNAAVLGANYPDSKWYKYAYNLVGEGSEVTTAGKKSWLKGLLSEKPDRKTPGELPKGNQVDTILEKMMNAF